MKTKLPMIVALAAAIGSAGAIAQEQPSTPNPSPSTGGATPPPFPAPATPSEPGRPPQPPPPPPPREEHRRDRGPQDQAGEDHEGPGFRGPRERRERPAEPRPFLGVMSAPVSPELGAQLGLPEGFGVLVQDVLPDSPAAKAGLQKHDVIKLFNDQQLTGPEQLAALVRAAGKDAQVTLTVVRKGQEQKLPVTIAERAMPPRRGGEGPFGEVPKLDPRGGPDEMRRFHEEMRRFHDRMRDWQEHQGDRGPDARRGDRGGVPPADILREARPGGGGQVFSSDGMTRLDGSRAHLMLKDNDGEIDVSAENGKRTLTAKNAKGEVVFSGPINTEEERKAVPEQFRKKLEKIQVRQQSDSQSASASASGSTGGPADAGAEADVQ